MVVADGIAAIILNRASAASQVCTLPAGQVGPVPVIGEEGFSQVLDVVGKIEE